jgi:hypothetical protein
MLSLLVPRLKPAHCWLHVFDPGDGGPALTWGANFAVNFPEDEIVFTKQ